MLAERAASEGPRSTRAVEVTPSIPSLGGRRGLGEEVPFVAHAGKVLTWVKRATRRGRVGGWVRMPRAVEIDQATSQEREYGVKKQ